MAYTNVLEHPPAGASMSTGQVCVGSEYYGFGLSHGSQSSQKHKGRGFLRPHPSDFSCSSPCCLTHQGMSFFRPFFFLLVDSFVFASVVPLAPDCVGAPFVLVAVSAFPVVVAPFAELSAAVGPLGSVGGTGFSSVPALVGATFAAFPR